MSFLKQYMLCCDHYVFYCALQSHHIIQYEPNVHLEWMNFRINFEWFFLAVFVVVVQATSRPVAVPLMYAYIYTYCIYSCSQPPHIATLASWRDIYVVFADHFHS